VKKSAGIPAEDASALLREFFAARRGGTDL